MAEDKWYEFFNKSNGNPVAYLKGQENSLHYDKITNQEFYFEELAQNASNLEYRLTKESYPQGYFKYKTHAEKFNQEILKGKGLIEPNPKQKKLTL